MKLVIGVTGTTGSGKSFICVGLKLELEKRGLETIILDADFIAKHIRDKSKSGKLRIKQALGPDVYDENDVSVPAKISAIIWNPQNEARRREFESIFQEKVPAKVMKTISKLQDNQALILDFWSIFTYLENCLRDINKIILVHCSEATQIDRLTKPPRNVPKELATKRVREQRCLNPIEELRQRVDIVIENEECVPVNFEEVGNQLLLPKVSL